MRPLLASLVLTALATLPVAAQTKAPPASTLTTIDKPFVPANGIDPNELAVDVVNKTVPVLCAEKDNVQLDFISPPEGKAAEMTRRDSDCAEDTAKGGLQCRTLLVSLEEMLQAAGKMPENP